MFRFLIAAAALTVSSAAGAHSFWLQPEEHRPEAGEEVRVDFKVGHPGDVNDWGLYWERIASLRLIGPDGVEDQQRAVRTTGEGEPGGAVVSMRAPGSYVLAFESNPSFSDLPADRFNPYVEKHGMTAISQHRETMGATGEKGTELYARRAKTILQVGDRVTGNATRRIGQILEIVPLANPFALAEGDTLHLQVFWRGEPLAGAKVYASELSATEEGPSLTTSLDGVVSVPAPVEDGMLYSVVWGEPAPNDARADYFTMFASLTVAAQ